jgi:octaprenyl-diphosphate synthase
MTAYIDNKPFLRKELISQAQRRARKARDYSVEIRWMPRFSWLLARIGAAAGAALSRLRRRCPYNLSMTLATSSSILSLTDGLADDLRALDQRLRATLDSDVSLIRSISEYIVSAGGKRLRPILVFLCHEALSGEANSETAISLAATVELIHTATLLHDDVVDESELRRGRPTANAEFGNAASVLVGDFLYSRAFQVMVATQNLRVLHIVSEATNRIAEGEVMQLMALGNLDLTEAQYMDVIEAKTAKLFEAAGALGAIAAGADAAHEMMMANYARRLGVAFQIADDVLDYRGDEHVLGKSLGDDLAEGKLTLPIILALARATPDDREWLRSIIRDNRQTHGHEHLPKVRALLESCGALESSMAAATKHAQSAATELATLPESRAKSWMLALCEYAVNRSV